MTSYHSLRIGVVAVLLAVLLAVSAVPAAAQPVLPSRPLAVHVAGFGERLWNAFISLWPSSLQKASIDPNGRSGQAVNPNPPVTPNEGTSIDPNGK
jgi:hypothetical protein